MNFRVKKIQLDELVLYPSTNYSASISGVFDIDKDNEYADIISDGLVFGGGKVTSKKMNLNVIVKKYNNIQLHMRLNTILARKTQTLKLTYDILGDVEIDVQVESKATKSGVAGEIAITLNAPDPYLRVQKRELILGSTMESGLKFGTKLPTKLGVGDSEGIGVLYNASYNIEYPFIEVLTHVNWIILTNKTTNQTIRLDLNTKVSDSVVIDCRPLKQGVYINGKRQNYIILDWFRCEPGDNEFSIYSNVNSLEVCKITVEGRML